MSISGAFGVGIGGWYKLKTCREFSKVSNEYLCIKFWCVLWELWIFLGCCVFSTQSAQAKCLSARAHCDCDFWPFGIPSTIFCTRAKLQSAREHCKALERTQFVFFRANFGPIFWFILGVALECLGVRWVTRSPYCSRRCALERTSMSLERLAPRKVQ